MALLVATWLTVFGVPAHAEEPLAIGLSGSVSAGLAAEHLQPGGMADLGWGARVAASLELGQDWAIQLSWQPRGHGLQGSVRWDFYRDDALTVGLSGHVYGWGEAGLISVQGALALNLAWAPLGWLGLEAQIPFFFPREFTRDIPPTAMAARLFWPGLNWLEQVRLGMWAAVDPDWRLRLTVAGRDVMGPGIYLTANWSAPGQASAWWFGLFGAPGLGNHVGVVVGSRWRTSL